MIINDWNYDYDNTHEWAVIADKIETVWLFYDAPVIDKNIFRDAVNLESIRIKSPYMKVENNVLYDAGKTKLIAVPVKTSGSFTVNQGVEELCDYAFCNSGITSLTLPESLTAIGDGAISSCENLTDIYYEGTKVFGAVYGGGVLKDVTSVGISNNTVPDMTLSFAEGDTVKVFVWENNAVPVTYAEALPIQ